MLILLKPDLAQDALFHYKLEAACITQDSCAMYSARVGHKEAVQELHSGEPPSF